MGPGDASFDSSKNSASGRGDHGGKPSRRGPPGEVGSPTQIAGSVDRGRPPSTAPPRDRTRSNSSARIRAAAEADLVVTEPLVVGRRGRPATVSHGPPV